MQFKVQPALLAGSCCADPAVWLWCCCSSTLSLGWCICFFFVSSTAEIQSCLVSSGDVGCGMFQCFSNNSCDIQGLHHICLTLLHNAGRYDSQVSGDLALTINFPLFFFYLFGTFWHLVTDHLRPGLRRRRRHILIHVFSSFNPVSH